MPYVYSTLSTNVAYAVYKQGGADLPIIERTVLIEGGTGVANKQTLITPYGVSNEVTDEDLALLEANEVFQRHVAAKFITVRKKAIKPEKAAGDMNVNDKSRQLTPGDFAPDKVPKVGKHVGEK